MDHFAYRSRSLYCENIPVAQLAERYGTPLYIYSKATLVHHLRQIQEAFKEVEPLICYSVKTNGNVALCKVMAEQGSGFDVTSGGELHRALLAGGKGEKIVFAGVGKTDAEFRYALDNNVSLFNVESEQELHALGHVAKSMGKVAS
ncbi:MAG: diaminopimelate decarboxylase, partial [Planctomycetia bacterium]|nr:diaminopimelate decarboxylase [Planctomycetia bacterium]